MGKAVDVQTSEGLGLFDDCPMYCGASLCGPCPCIVIRPYLF